MRASKSRSLLVMLVIFCSGCSHKTSPPPQQAQAPPLQTGKGTLSSQQTSQQQEKTDAPLASPLPTPTAQSVPLPPPPPPKTPKKPKHKVKTPPANPADATQAAAAAPAAGSSPSGSSGTQSSAQAAVPPSPAADHAAAASPIGQLTTGDSASGEKTKHETSDLIGGTEQGLNAIRRSLSTDEKATASQIRTYLKEAQQALDNGDTDGAHLLATKAKLLLDELTKQ
jgi:hypothetical protein